MAPAGLSFAIAAANVLAAALLYFFFTYVDPPASGALRRPLADFGVFAAVTATIVGIDSKARTVTLKGPRQTVELAVADDIDLSKAKVGDQVGAVYQEAFGLLVEPAPK